ncbi:hypothetical protein [Sphingobium xenophagum]|uniref:hypothetical protein n=1 Tax=Sphingobium xenophagum TaxID=121428 RepID=UPI001C0CA55F|nr:hypothetical protein [Sphingobium xenophagum]QWT14553.1 hypothetical protein GTV57_01885 [Sphingobium xenophagum]
MAEPISAEAEAAVMYQAVGVALGHWVQIEQNLYCIFAGCLGPSCARPDGSTWTGGTGASSALYSSIENFRVRVNMITGMIDTLMSFDHPDDIAIKTLWASESKKINKCAGNRNKLAHWEVMMFNDKAPMRRARLMPSMHSREYGELAFKPEPGFSITDVQGWGNSFSQAAEKLRPIYTRIALHERLQGYFKQLVEAQEQNRQWMLVNPGL